MRYGTTQLPPDGIRRLGVDGDGNAHTIISNAKLDVIVAFVRAAVVQN
jgi:membrane-bound lytic murein transglycosylase B